jgi:hypothetical protein
VVRKTPESFLVLCAAAVRAFEPGCLFQQLVEAPMLAETHPVVLLYGSG